MSEGGGGSAAALTACLFVNSVWAESFQIEVSSTSIYEGGMVAQQLGRARDGVTGGCPARTRTGAPTATENESSASFYTRYLAWLSTQATDDSYCEFRDTVDDDNPSHARSGWIEVTVKNTRAVEYFIQLVDFNRNDANSTIPTGVGSENRVMGTEGGTVTLFEEFSAIHNYIPDGDKTFTLRVRSWDPVGRDGRNHGDTTITIIDDDDTAYIGRRRAHPYGEMPWQLCCWEHNCAHNNNVNFSAGCSP